MELSGIIIPRKALKFYYDIWSNIHYGFVGKYAGFLEFELLNGAGYAQIGDNKMELNRWETWKQYLKNRSVDLGDADILGDFDDASDQQAIKIGFRLYDKFGENPQLMTANDILNELYLAYSQGKPLTIKICENH